MYRLKHSKSTLAEGVSALLWLGLILIGLGCFQVFFFPIVWPKDPWFVILFGIIEALVALAVVLYATINIRKNQTFVCLIDEEQIECVSPIDDGGHSFRLPLAQIQRLEPSGEESPNSWCLYDHDGNRYWLTSDYNNPAEKFVREIRRIRPDLQESEP